ncbi:hypothetical protein [Pseudomonas sp. CM27]|uniref:hypothetical protein n=1 Tax=Pseudomonas sp. CM27 TaxID=2738452 RepID=UPI00155549D3|nr:hypothetical protein [Pseudomonas sp. CM27]NQD72903.1 hypothetical protein [Pseudomonas sp. CM27]
MDAARFDSTVQSFTKNWEFELLIRHYEQHAENTEKHLEFCVLLADLGLLENLHLFICKVGLYSLKKLASDPNSKYAKSGNAKILLEIYESEILPTFEHQPGRATGIDHELLCLSRYKDTTVLENYILSKKDDIFQIDQNPKTLMYLTYALNQLWSKTKESHTSKITLSNFSNFKNLSAIRRAYITKNVCLRIITCEESIAFPQLGHNDLQKLLGIIAAQKSRYRGAERAYDLVSDIVRKQLAKPTTSKNLGWNIKPRVAVCMSGIYRCGNLAVESIFENIIKPLEADVFFHSWTEMQDWPGLGGAGDEWVIRTFNKEILSKCPPTIRSKKQFKSKFPKSFEKLDTASLSEFKVEKLPPEIKFTKVLLDNDATVFSENGIDINNFLSLDSPNQAKMIYGIYKAHELAVEHEKQNGFRYDYIIRCRPDVFLKNKLTFDLLEDLKSHDVAMEFSKEWGPQDQFWYAQRAPALTMASLWSASLDSNSLSPFPLIPSMRAHNLILGWMTDNHLQPVNTPIKRDMNLVNSQATPPDFSAALIEDFTNEAKDLSQSQATLDFFAALKGFNKK